MYPSPHINNEDLLKINELKKSTLLQRQLERRRVLNISAETPTTIETVITNLKYS